MIYAQIDDNKICYSVAVLNEEITDDKMIKLDNYDSNLLGKKWNGQDWESVETKPQPTPELPDASIALLEGLASVSEQLQKLEKRQTQMENNQIAVLEGLATMSEGKPNV